MEKISLAGTKEYKEIIMKNSVAEAGELINENTTDFLMSAVASSVIDLTSRLPRREYTQQFISQDNLTLQFSDLETARRRRNVAPGTMIFDPMERELYINVGFGRWRRIETSAVDV